MSHVSNVDPGQTELPEIAPRATVLCVAHPYPYWTCITRQAAQGSNGSPALGICARGAKLFLEHFATFRILGDGALPTLVGFDFGLLCHQRSSLNSTC
jgi:hypothetical protein